MSHAPNLSVIVACLNPGARLHAALASVWAQRGTALELIVVDGGSTDGTLAWLESRRAQIATLIAEPDRGVYDAMNKGVAAARGEWLYFLGADDRFADDGAAAAALAHARGTGAGVVAGEAAFADGRIYRFDAAASPLARNFVHHQAALYRRALFGDHGSFDPALAVMADYDFNLRLRQRGVRFAPIPVRLAICGTGGLSDRGAWRGYREEIAVRHRHGPAWRSLGWDALSVVRWVRKKIVRIATHD
ncbi:MAG: glycosyltransferase family 2 protein [Opitutaceae bacterium]|nr:glycosyltransferase family 2 protein [Opitutaceae bacterium]